MAHRVGIKPSDYAKLGDMDRDAALAQLVAVKARLDELKAAQDEMYATVRAAAASGVRQAEIVRITDWSREHIRNIVAGKVKA